MTASALLRTDGLSCTFGGLRALRAVSFEQGQDEILGIIGPNGAGKSTLLNVLNGSVRPSSGEVYFREKRITHQPPDKTARAGLVKTFQTSRPFGSMTFRENVMTAAFARTHNKAHALDIAGESLCLVDLEDYADSPAAGASTGQRKRLEIARALAVKPRLLLLDEPFGGVDVAAIDALVELLRGLRETGTSILLIEHNLEAVQNLADRLIAMNFGTIIADGSPASVVHDPAVVRAYLGDEDVVGAA